MVETAARPILRTAPPPPVVLFYTDNGRGLGHLSRQAAVANRAGGAFRPFFLTMSAGFTLLEGLGLSGEYFPSYGVLGLAKSQWEPILTERLLEAIRLTGTSVVVVDHVSPPRVFGRLRGLAEGVQFVWSRRGLWQSGKNSAVLQMSDSFDLVVEPGDLASPIDQGATVASRQQTTSIGPVVMTDRNEFMPKDQARDALGIPRSGRALLVSLGDTDPVEVGRLISHTRSVVNSVATDRIHLFAPLHPLHGDSIPKTAGVTMRRVYPVARYFNAFDGAVSAAGYNTFHEIVNSGIPAVFVPHRGAFVDDQVRRAEFAALCGRAHWAPSVYSDAFREAVTRMLRSGEVAVAQETTSVLGEMKGAHEFAEILADMARAVPRDTVRSIPHAPSKRRVARGAETTLIDARELDDDQLLDLSSSLGSDRLGNTVLLVRDGDPWPLYNKGLVFESMLTEPGWSALGECSYSEYVDLRLEGIMTRYDVDRMIALPDGSTPRVGNQRGSVG